MIGNTNEKEAARVDKGGEYSCPPDCHRRGQDLLHGSHRHHDGCRRRHPAREDRHHAGRRRTDAAERWVAVRDDGTYPAAQSIGDEISEDNQHAQAGEFEAYGTLPYPDDPAGRQGHRRRATARMLFATPDRHHQHSVRSRRRCLPNDGFDPSSSRDTKATASGTTGRGAQGDAAWVMYNLGCARHHRRRGCPTFDRRQLRFRRMPSSSIWRKTASGTRSRMSAASALS